MVPHLSDALVTPADPRRLEAQAGRIVILAGDDEVLTARYESPLEVGSNVQGLWVACNRTRPHGQGRFPRLGRRYPSTS